MEPTDNGPVIPGAFDPEFLKTVGVEPDTHPGEAQVETPVETQE